MAEDEYPNLKTIFARNISSEGKETKDNVLLGSENSILIRMKVSNKYQYIKRKMLIILISMTIPFALTITAVSDSSWLFSESLDTYSLLYAYDSLQALTFNYSDYIDIHCRMKPSREIECEFLESLKILGAVLFALYVISLIMNLISAIILALIIRWPDVLEAIKSKTGWKMKLFSIFALVGYILSIAIFLIICLVEKPKDYKFGRDFFFALAGCLVYGAVFLYYWRLKRKWKKNSMVSKLLNPDNLLMRSNFAVRVRQNGENSSHESEPIN